MEPSDTSQDSWADGRITLKKLCARDEDAWTLLLTRLSLIAIGYVTRSFSSDENVVTAEDAEDLASKLALSLYKNINDFTSLGHLEGYFRTALKNDALDLKEYLQAEKRGGGKVHSFGDPEILAGKKPLKQPVVEDWELLTNKAVEDDGPEATEALTRITPETTSELLELRRIIFDAVGELKPHERKMVNLVYLGHKQAEMATILKMSVKKIGTMLGRIYQKLRPKIIDRMSRNDLKNYGITTA